MSFHRNTCLNCGSHDTITLSSQDRLICADCRSYSVWTLKEGVQSVLEDRKGDKTADRILPKESERTKG